MDSGRFALAGMVRGIEFAEIARRRGTGPAPGLAMTNTGTRILPPQLDPCRRPPSAGWCRGRRTDRLRETVTRVGGFSIAGLDPITPLLVRTWNSLVRIAVSSHAGRRILVQGGSYFPQTTPAELEGSSLGGSLLKQGWIATGLRMDSTEAAHRDVARALDRDQRDDGLPGP